MAKEFYDVSHKTYFNNRIKEVFFQGRETWPLYEQVTYDRKTIFFKSYYFDLFAQPKYNFLKMPLSLVEDLEGRVIDYIIARDADRFSLDRLLRQYKIFSQDLLDHFDGPFKLWMAGYFKEEKLSGLSALLEQTADGVAGVQLWDDLKKCLDPAVFARMEEQAARSGPYFPLAAYVRQVLPKGPFCLPLHEWLDPDKQAAIGDFMDERYRQVDMGAIIRTVRLALFPKGF